jgi:hypothetical protein
MAMNSNQVFSFKRLKGLLLQSYYLNGKILLVTTCGYIGSIFLTLLFLLLVDRHYLHWNNRDYFNTFLFFFIPGGVMYSCLAFSGFRSKERRYSYLMLPVTVLEKFIYEFVGRVILFIIIIPIVFWIVANIGGSIVHFFDADFLNYKYSFVLGLEKAGFFKTSVRELLIVVSGGLLLFTVPFLGATYFRKNPTLKLLLSVGVIIIFYVIYIALLVKFLDLKNHQPPYFIRNGRVIEIFFVVLFSLINVVALLIGYFNVKEKEA